MASHARAYGRKAGIADADDDGCAIFWRASRFHAHRAPEFLMVARAKRIKPGSAKVALAKRVLAVRVCLACARDGALLHVVCSHLASGDKAEDEAERLEQVHTDGLAAWFASSAENGAGAPPITALLCLDANSSPARPEANTVWKALRGLPGAASVWDGHFAPDGALRTALTAVSTNKMRGPLSTQVKKVGEHMAHVIDHVFALQLGAPESDATAHGSAPLRHAWGPMEFSSAAQALRHLIPSLRVPSDHYPVLCELELPPPPPPPPPLAARIGASLSRHARVACTPAAPAIREVLVASMGALAAAASMAALNRRAGP